jgi:hypothetical protein
MTTENQINDQNELNDFIKTIAEADLWMVLSSKNNELSVRINKKEAMSLVIHFLASHDKTFWEVVKTSIEKFHNQESLESKN